MVSLSDSMISRSVLHGGGTSHLLKYSLFILQMIDKCYPTCFLENKLQSEGSSINLKLLNYSPSDVCIPRTLCKKKKKKQSAHRPKVLGGGKTLCKGFVTIT